MSLAPRLVLAKGGTAAAAILSPVYAPSLTSMDRCSYLARHIDSAAIDLNLPIEGVREPLEREGPEE